MTPKTPDEQLKTILDKIRRLVRKYDRLVDKNYKELKKEKENVK